MTPFSLRAAAQEDAEWMAELRAVVLRLDLERLGRFDPVRVRRRFLDAYIPENTRVIVVDGVDVGTIAVRSEADAVWIEHFYLAPDWQGRGVGGAVLDGVLAERAEQPFRLNVLRGSAAARLYARRGFEVERADEVDVFLRRDPSPR